MSVTITEGYGLAVAAEVRAWMGRRGLNQHAVALAAGRDDFWVSRRVRGLAKMTVEDLAVFAQVLDCSISDLLPRLDSNQQPSGMQSGLVSQGTPFFPEAA